MPTEGSWQRRLWNRRTGENLIWQGDTLITIYRTRLRISSCDEDNYVVASNVQAQQASKHQTTKTTTNDRRLKTTAAVHAHTHTSFPEWAHMRHARSSLCIFLNTRHNYADNGDWTLNIWHIYESNFEEDWRINSLYSGNFVKQNRATNSRADEKWHEAIMTNIRIFSQSTGLP